MRYIVSTLASFVILARCLAADSIEYNKEEPFPDPQHPGKTVTATSNLCGLGGIINKVDGKCLIIKIFPGSGAERAKLQINDEILKVEGRDISQDDIYHIAKQIRGNPNTNVILTIVRKGIATPFEVTVTRLPFEVPVGG